ncbi:ferric reductase-like transmembrane domain-containing protein [Pseudomonas sp. F1_0610]|uniref:ferredoxin reductase family protein n=1 Tax=Pseudomonas sp. F1_0610 TaxID=3114284 RepID=UPI0039C10E4B
MKKLMWGTGVVSLLIWGISLLLLPENTNMDIWFWRKQLIYVTGVASFAYMSLIMLLAIRPKWLENPLNGLDKMYRLHKWAGIWAISLGVVHYLIKLSKDILILYVERGAKGPREDWFLDIFRGAAKDLGEWAVYFSIAMLVITLWKKFPYDKWRIIHKSLSAFFLVIVFHGVVLSPSEWWLQPIGMFMAVCSLLGSYCAVIAIFGRIGAQRRFSGKVESVEQLANGIVEITCNLGKNWHHTQGQFAFIKHTALGEQHPFTISSADKHDGRVRFAIKSLGDDTTLLYHSVKVGDKVEVEGPYGCFSYNENSQTEQLWVAAGIGVTPFIAWLEGLQEQPEKAPKVTLHYCANNEQEGVYAKRLQALTETIDNITLVIHYSEQEGYLTADKLLQGTAQNTPIWFCGPSGFAKAIKTGMQKAGRDLALFHNEYFEIR